MGYIERRELPKIFAISDVLVLPSLQETWGIVVNEAMASGLAVLISKRCGCVNDLVRNGFNGYAFDPINPNHLVKLMSKIMHSNSTLAGMKNNSLEIISQYTPEYAACRFFQAIDRIAKTTLVSK